MNDIEWRLAESVARATTRRRFLRRAAEGTFIGLSGWLVAGPLARSARSHTKNGQGHCAYTTGIYSCNFVNGLCGGCNGHACPTGYSWYTGTYPSACWCTKSSFGNYYICCDCKRNTSQYLCGCRTYVTAGLAGED